jgi:DNA-binding MarR family transcriptional regulator
MVKLLDISHNFKGCAMDAKNELERQVLAAARENGMSSVLFRRAIGRRLGLNVTDYECLSLLAMRGTSTPTELARYTGLTSGSATAMLDRLERAGFITRRPNPSDRRGVLVDITAKWGATAGPLVAGVQQAHTELLTRYTETELEAIADFLTRFTDNVKAQTALVEGSPVSAPGHGQGPTSPS